MKSLVVFLSLTCLPYQSFATSSYVCGEDNTITNMVQGVAETNKNKFFIDFVVGYSESKKIAGNFLGLTMSDLDKDRNQTLQLYLVPEESSGNKNVYVSKDKRLYRQFKAIVTFRGAKSVDDGWVSFIMYSIHVLVERRDQEMQANQAFVEKVDLVYEAKVFGPPRKVARFQNKDGGEFKIDIAMGGYWKALNDGEITSHGVFKCPGFEINKL